MAFATLSLVTATATALAQTPESAACRAIYRSAQTLPEPSICLQRLGLAPASADDSPAASSQVLYAYADERIKLGNFDAASAALDCAEAAIVESPKWPSRYELIRRRGVLAYRQERIVDALNGFECALEMARDRGDRAATAKQLKNVGSALRRLGDFRGALRALSLSLDMQRADGDPDVGAVLNNIADVYRELRETEEARRYYLEAHEAFRRKGERIEAAHVLETMSVLALDRGDATEAERLLEDALGTYREVGSKPYELQVHADLARAAISRGDLDKAARWSSIGLALAAEHGLSVPPSLHLQVARVDRLRDRSQAAIVRLRSAIAALSTGDVERPALLDELSVALEAVGDSAGAIQVLREARNAEQVLSKAREDRQLAWLRTRFETAERDRTIAALEDENRLRKATLRQRTLMLWLTAVSALAAILALSIAFQRRQQRTRLAEAERRIRFEEEMARYRREVDALAEDRSLLQTLLDSREDAVCLLDPDGQILAANRAISSLLGVERERLSGKGLSQFLRETDAPILASALVRMEDAAEQELAFARGADGRSLSAKLTQWERGDGLTVVNLRDATATHAIAAPAEPNEHASGEEQARAEFRRELVELMLAVVEAWERSSGLSRLELAERSRIWRVNIDDGRLRARAMERYLSLSKLPQNPRWRDVLRSMYFVLGQCQLDESERERLQQRADAVFAYARRSALV